MKKNNIRNEFITKEFDKSNLNEVETSPKNKTKFKPIAITLSVLTGVALLSTAISVPVVLTNNSTVQNSPIISDKLPSTPEDGSQPEDTIDPIFPTDPNRPNNPQNPGKPSNPSTPNTKYPNKPSWMTDEEYEVAKHGELTNYVYRRLVLNDQGKMITASMINAKNIGQYIDILHGITGTERTVYVKDINVYIWLESIEYINDTSIKVNYRVRSTWDQSNKVLRTKVITGFKSKEAYIQQHTDKIAESLKLVQIAPDKARTIRNDIKDGTRPTMQQVREYFVNVPEDTEDFEIRLVSVRYPDYQSTLLRWAVISKQNREINTVIEITIKGTNY